MNCIEAGREQLNCSIQQVVCRGKMENKFQVDASFVCNEVSAADIGVPTLRRYF
jgi:hypothetical protein